MPYKTLTGWGWGLGLERTTVLLGVIRNTGAGRGEDYSAFSCHTKCWQGELGEERTTVLLLAIQNTGRGQGGERPYSASPCHTKYFYYLHLS